MLLQLWLKKKKKKILYSLHKYCKSSKISGGGDTVADDIWLKLLNSTPTCEAAKDVFMEK